MTETQAIVASMPETELPKPRIGLICDFVEEGWPSMDLVAEMLFQYLESEQASHVQVSRICPPLQRRLGRLPGIGAAPVFQNADRLLNRFVDYSRHLKAEAQEFDLYHLVDHSYSQLVHDLPSGRTVVTCHDLDTFRCVLEPAREPRPRWFRAMTERILSGFRKAAHVIADSGSTRDELLRFGLVPADRVTVISNGVHPACVPDPNPPADQELHRLLSGHPADSIWLLNVGSTIPRKRMDVLLRVFAEVRKQAGNVRLLRVGQPLTAEQRQLAGELGVTSGLVELGFLSRDVLSAAYRRARLLLHTADAEGFGIPPIEAMACGCEVIASDLPVLREVGGTAATYCPVGDIENWKDTVLRAVQNRDYDRAPAYENAARFSWRENAARTARVYQQVLAQGILGQQLLGKGL
jgi:glycosyltransferase involved in cell wall biosynthesis